MPVMAFTMRRRPYRLSVGRSVPIATAATSSSRVSGEHHIHAAAVADQLERQPKLG